MINGLGIADRVMIAVGEIAFAGVLLALSALPARSQQDAPLTDCDTYAGSEFGPQRKTAGVTFAKINSALAIPACESAVRQYPDSDRLIFQLVVPTPKEEISALLSFNCNVLPERGTRQRNKVSVLCISAAGASPSMTPKHSLGSAKRRNK